MIAYQEALNDDQMKNQWTAVFSNIPGGGDSRLLTLRLDQSIDIPEREIEEYTIDYQGIKIPKTSLKEGTTKEFTLNFRLDSNWVVYQSLNNWFKKVFNESDGTGGSEADTRTDMLFNTYGADKKLTFSIKFNKVKIKKLKLETFEMGSADPARVEATFIFVDIENTIIQPPTVE